MLHLGVRMKATTIAESDVGTLGTRLIESREDMRRKQSWLRTTVFAFKHVEILGSKMTHVKCLIGLNRNAFTYLETPLQTYICSV